MTTPKPAVFLTGASGGIGVATVRALTAHGFRVYAGIRGDTPAFEGLADVEPVSCDVTDPGSVSRAAKQVTERQQGRGLRAVINNAGIVVQGPVELITLDEWKRQFDVNLFGPVLVTQQFLPLLREGNGRLINISAAAARVTPPFFGPASASKAALQSFSDAARMELAPWHIPVITIEPGATRTAVMDKAAAAAQAALDTVPDEQRAAYQRQIDTFNDVIANQKFAPAATVAKTIVKAVRARRPKTRYVVGADARTVALLAHLPLTMRDRILTRFLGLHKITNPGWPRVPV